MSCYLTFFFFFFQAEDGIRDLVRSRGLGDVYKRQGVNPDSVSFSDSINSAMRRGRGSSSNMKTPGTTQTGRLDLVSTCMGVRPVSYTHLTLPTSDLV